MTDRKEEDLGAFLEKHGLQSSKWLPLFRKECIYKPDQIIAIKGSREHYHNLSSRATDKNEEYALKMLLEIVEVTIDPSIEIEKILAESGLDSTFWFPIFKDELGVTSLQALANVGEESFDTLQQFVRKPWERKALCKLLNMDDQETSLKSQRGKRREKFKKRQEESFEMLQQLKDLQKEGKERHCEAVQEIESGIREALQISPDTWISSDKSLESMINTLEKNLTQLDGILQSRRDITDHQVLRTASGGLAMQGILLSKDINDQIETRDSLLKPPEDIQLMGPSLSKMERIEEFSSQSQEDSHRQSMDKLGYSATASFKGGFWGVSVEVGGGCSKANESESTSEQHQKSLYKSTVKYSFVPIASTYFNDSQLLLSDDALRRLKKVETLLTSKPNPSIVQEECQMFFKTFGSHATKGPLHFGGIYWLKSVSRAFEKSALETVKQLQREVVNMKASVSYGSAFGASAEANRSQIEASFSGRYSKELVSGTTLEITATGGPHEVSNLPQWKSCMAACNSTWSVIDRGTATVPVWEIIQVSFLA